MSNTSSLFNKGLRNCPIYGKENKSTYWACPASINDHYNKLLNLKIPYYIPKQQHKQYIIEYFKKERDK